MTLNAQNPPKKSHDYLDFFVAGGAMRKGAPSYITRPADEQLQQAARRGEFCYVLTPRQMGKSSMMVRASAHLEEDGYRTVVIDLTQIGTTATMDQWYIGFLLRVVSKLKLTVDLSDWWQTHHRLPVVQRFSQFFQEVVLAQVSDTVVIFVDEIDYSLVSTLPPTFLPPCALYSMLVLVPLYLIV